MERISSSKSDKLNIQSIVLIGVMVATIETAKWAISFLMNVEIVTLLIILYTLFFGKKVFFAIYSFVLIEGILYGFGIWWIMYLYVWTILALLTLCFKQQKSVWFWSIFSAFYGLSFGALCSIPYFFIGGASMAFGWWVAGIPADILHGVSNFILCLILFPPLRNILQKISLFFPV